MYFDVSPWHLIALAFEHNSLLLVNNKKTNPFITLLALFQLDSL